VALPWYGLALAVEGRPFWDSFFGYHNLQRFTAVVNDHLQPWWFFGPVLVIASLPATPLLLLALGRGLSPLPLAPGSARPLPPPSSLARFAACWLVVVLLFFTAAATKLPSYWLPATPAAGLLIALEAQGASQEEGRALRWAWRATVLLTLVLGAGFLAAPLWVPLIRETELPTLSAELMASGLLSVAGICWLLAGLAGVVMGERRSSLRLVALQLPLVAFVPAALLPLWALGDRLRGEPVRQMAAALTRFARPGEPVAMVGILKPSLHYYSRRVVIYEGNWRGGLVNLADRLRKEHRSGQVPSTAEQMPTVLVVIDGRTAQRPFWQGLAPEELDRAGLYRLWRLDRRRLEARAATLRAAGRDPTWQDPKPERY
jgi:4-amino-4-deoxy-L-arabinose transferase-like glycosyltransferase